MSSYDHDEVNRLIHYKYEAAFSAAKKKSQQAAAQPKKKVASYMVKKAEESKEEPLKDLQTAIAEKKDVKNLKDSYDPRYTEKYWYQWWEDRKFFTADEKKGVDIPYEKKFIIVVPPPNVTGYLHIGHGLTAAIEDCLVRWRRMQGYLALYLPGTDHAGIATQSVVEKTLWKNEKKTRYDFSREAFLEKVWEWKEKHGNKILEQFRRIGSSFDWDRLAFTMDKKLSTAVIEAFVRLHERGLIYRSNRLVNWSCKLKTALSDIEVEYQDIEKPTLLSVPNHTGKYEFGVLISFAYKLKDPEPNGIEEIVVATTRIETMLGDTAVAVNSKDPRYQNLIGKELIHPFVPSRKMKVIADDQLVDMAFGTGCVKITPAHDFNDYECGMRHKLEFVNIFTEDGKINENGGSYAGMMRFDCRNQILKDLDAKRLFRGKAPNVMRLGFCSRSGDVIEPFLKPQWYVSCGEISKKMIEVVKNKELLIVPEEFEKDWYRWLENIRDWCISRQIIWGHQCPVYLVTIEGSGKVPDSSKGDDWVAARNLEEAYEKAAKKFGVDRSKISLKQDEDVLDTWFSSGLFPFSPFDWPNEQSLNFKSFYPNTLLETGHDILFFWVARMVMMGLLLCGKLPFKHVFLHPIIRDAFGRKMSKSLGNVIDPLEIIEGCSLDKLIEKLSQGTLDKGEYEKAAKEKKTTFPEGIPECGTDALRFGLLAYMIQGRNINLDVKRIIAYRQFCNKIWNSFKLAISKVDYNQKYDLSAVKDNELVFIHRWVLSKFNTLVKALNNHFEKYEFGEAANKFHSFWIYDFCDVYLEAVKNIIYGSDPKEKEIANLILLTVLEEGLKLLHPMMPFLTEELYQKLPNTNTKAESITIANYPEAQEKYINKEVEEQFDDIFAMVKTVRSLISSVNLPNNVKPKVFVIFLNEDKRYRELILKNDKTILTLAKISELTIKEDEKDVPAGTLTGLVNKNVQVRVLVKEHLKIEVEIERLQKKINENENFIATMKKKMGIPDYEKKVPEEIRKSNQEKLEELLIEKKKLEESMVTLKNI